MKGIILAAGRGTRLYPMTKPVCKPLLPVYDKPLIYYPLSVLIQAGIREILLIVPPGEIASFRALLGDGSSWGMRLTYAEQPVPKGIADALLIGREFAGQDSVCLALGDNIFYGPRLGSLMKQAVELNSGALVFARWDENPRAHGVIEFDTDGTVRSLEEKPLHPKSHYVVPGLYFYDAQVMKIAAGVTPSRRGELEITDVNLEYLRRGQLHVLPLDRSCMCLDAGSPEQLLTASQLVRDVQEKKGQYVGCPEELALAAGWITREQIHTLGSAIGMTAYGRYLLKL